LYEYIHKFLHLEVQRICEFQHALLEEEFITHQDG